MIPRTIALVLVLSCMACLSAVSRDIHVTIPRDAGPQIQYGLSTLADSLKAAGNRMQVSVEEPQERVDLFVAAPDPSSGPAESYEIVPGDSGQVTLRAADPAGTMYGLLEIAEWAVSQAGDLDWSTLDTRSGNPFLQSRGDIQIITCEKEGDLSDWFLSEKYWSDHIDLLARNRYNLLDLQGVFNLSTGEFTNLLPYFVLDATASHVHRPAEEIRANREMLQKIVGMAADRGIGVWLMTHGTALTPANIVCPDASIASGTDANVDFDWVGDGPLEILGPDNWAIRWTGYVVPPTTGTYTFTTAADDGTRLWVDEKQLIDDWKIHGIVEQSGRIELQAGEKVPIRLEYLEWMYAAVVKLSWTRPDGTTEVIAPEFLLQPDGASPGLKAEYFHHRTFSTRVSRRLAADLVNELDPPLAGIGFHPLGSPDEAAEAEKVFIPLLENHPEAPRLIRGGSSTDPGQLASLGGRVGSRMVLETDWNGSHLGLPYPVTDSTHYLDRHVAFTREFQRLWRIGAGGTHRLFPWFDPGFVRKAVENSRLFHGTGFAVESIGVYGPRSTDRLFVSRQQAGGHEFTNTRNWFWYMAWGRLGYDPGTPDDVFRNAFARQYGTQGEALFDALVSASQVIPSMAAAHCEGFGLNDMAPELEFANDFGAIDHFIHVPPMESSTRLSVNGEIREKVTGVDTGKRAPSEVAVAIREAGKAAEKGVSGLSAPGEVDSLVTDIRMLSALGESFADYTEAAVSLALYYRTGDPAALARTREVLENPVRWQALCDLADAQYRPFLTALRPKSEGFTWRNGLKDPAGDLKRIEVLEAEATGIESRVALPDRDKAGDSDAPVITEGELNLEPGTDSVPVTVTVEDSSGVESVTLHYRLVPSPGQYTPWESVPLDAVDGAWKGVLPLDGEGAFYYVEAFDTRGNAGRSPGVDSPRPYRLIAR